MDWLTKPTLILVILRHPPSPKQRLVCSSLQLPEWLILPLSTATPAIVPASCIEESAKIFEHSVSHLLLDDAQPLLDSDVGSDFEVEEGRNMSLQRGENTGTQIGIHVPPAAAYCQVVSSGNEDGGDDDDEVTDSTWVPDRAEEESEGEAQPQRGSHHGRVESSQAITLWICYLLAHFPQLSCLGLF